MTRIALALLLLASLAGCATTSRTRAADPEMDAQPRAASEAEPVPRRKPAVATPKPPQKAPESVVALEPAVAPPPPVTNAQAEFFCGTDGALERRVPSERPAGVVAFEPEMTRPEKLSGPPPLYTSEALEKNIQGQMLARCILTRAGTVRSCRILKHLPHLDEAVLSSLCVSRYTPVVSQGQPVDVEYTFNVRLTPP